MSFQDMTTTPAMAPLTVNSRRSRSVPRVIVQTSLSSDEEDGEAAAASSFMNSSRFNQPYIQHGHGRLQMGEEPDDSSPFESSHSSPCPPKPVDLVVAKNSMLHVPHSQLETLQQLQEFHELVSDLGLCLDAPQTPETIWRCKILVRTAKEADQQTLQALQDDYRAALQKDDKSAHTSLSVLRHEWLRVHKALAKSLKRYGMEPPTRMDTYDDNHRQRHTLASTGISDDEDYFDRVTREAEVNIVHDKMHLVHDIYRDLAVLVDQQQEPINKLQANVVDAQLTAEAAADEVACFSARNSFLESPCGGLPADGSRVSLNDDTEQVETDWNKFIFSYFDCQPLTPVCGPDDTMNEVEILCEGDNDDIEIQHVDPHVQETRAPTAEKWLENLLTLQDGILAKGMSLFDYCNPDACFDPISKTNNRAL